MAADGQEHLRATVKNLINDHLNSTLNDNVQLWSHADIREASGSIFSRLDRTLKAWGLRLDSEVPAYRRFPALLYEVTLQFKTLEEDLLKAEAAEKQSLLEKLGLQSADLLEIKNVSTQKGRGAGLFMAARNRKNQIGSFIEWIASEGQSGLAAADFLRQVYSDKYAVREVELTEQVMLSAFHNPVLGLGEWGDTEHSAEESSQYRRLEGLLESADKENT